MIKKQLIIKIKKVFEVQEIDKGLDLYELNNVDTPNKIQSFSISSNGQELAYLQDDKLLFRWGFTNYDCQTGYVKDKGVCVKCANYCETCTKSVLECDTCVVNRITFREDISKNCQCQIGYYDDNMDVTCKKCPISCETCQLNNQGNVICLTCRDSKISNRTLKNDQCVCNDGFFDNGIASDCQPCGPNCRICKDISQCLTCEDTYFVGLNRFCEKCDQKCKNCVENSTKCTSCNSEQNRELVDTHCACSQSFEEFSPPQLNCSPLKMCHPTCLTCSAFNLIDKCESCKENSELVVEGAMKKCACKTGYYYDKYTNLCQPCNQPCQACYGANSQSCLSCYEIQQNRELLDNQCICKSGYADLSTSTNNIYECKQCSQKCKTCSADGGCLSCYENEQNRILQNNNECNCKYGYVDQSVNNIYECKQCPQKCKTCAVDGSCLSCYETEQNRMLNSSNECICKSGYVDQNLNNIYECKQCPQKCKTCSADGGCLSCYETEQNRILNSNNECVCQTGYTEENDTCVQQQQPICHSSCKTCNGATELNCTSCFEDQNKQLEEINDAQNQKEKNMKCVCKESYYISSIDQVKCKECPPYCQKCNSSGECITCMTSIIIQSANTSSNNPPTTIQTNRFLDPKTNLCSCKESYYEEQLPTQQQINPIQNSKICTQCGQHCKKCKNKDICLECDDSRYELQQNGKCSVKITSTSEETVKKVEQTTQTSKTVLLGATMTGSVLISSIQPNSSIAAQFLLLQKLNLMLLLNIPYPQLLYGFFKAFGGDSPIESMKSINFLNKYIIKDDKGQLFGNKLQLEEIGDSIFYNSGGCITILILSWCLFIPMIILFKKNQDIQEGVEIKSKFVQGLKWMCLNFYPFIILFIHQIFTLLLFFSIAIQFSAFYHLNHVKISLFFPKLALTGVITIYLIFIILVLQRMINKKSNYYYDPSFHSKELIEQNIYLQLNASNKSDTFIERNYQLFYMIIENALFPIFITVLDFNFKIQLISCLGIQTILLLITVFSLPNKSCLENVFLIIQQFAWVVILSFIFLIGLKIQNINTENSTISSDDIELFTLFSWVVISACLVLLSLNPIQLLCMFLINLKHFKNSFLKIIKTIKDKLCKQQKKQDNKSKDTSLYDFSLDNSFGSSWSKSTLNQKALISMYPSIRKNAYQPSLLSTNTPSSTLAKSSKQLISNHKFDSYKIKTIKKQTPLNGDIEKKDNSNSSI